MSLNHAEETDVLEALYAQTLGREVLTYIKGSDPHLLNQQVCSKAVELLAEIKEILDDCTLDDSDCFQKIEAIVQVFQNGGLTVDRHWELE